MLAINNLTYYIGGRPIYFEASLHVKPKNKIALIGANGAGKSTLLRIIAGEYTPDEGDVTKSKETSIGYLNQDLLSFQSDDSILHIAMSAFSEALKIQSDIEALIQKMETAYEERMVEELATLQERFETLGGYSLKSKAEEILEGIGFRTEELEKPLSQFSGGWRMRVMLAKLLLEKPALLMLDEPTNHLDLPSIQWVENYLKNYEGAVIVVSHDQQFLNNCTNITVEVSGGKLNLYSGNYDFYKEEKVARQEVQRNAFENQQQKIKETERFIERFRSKATKARQVQSRVKELERMDIVEEVQESKAKVNIRFTFSQASGRFVATFDKVDKRYDQLEILKNATGVVEKGDKIALVGANGKGKSTLLRIIMGTEPIQSGEAKLGHNAIPSFFAQHQLESLSLENDLVEELKQTGTTRTETELRSILGAFLFNGDDVFKKIKVLSGGEKSRVALAKVLISEANFLLLDEPTNHLDIQSVNVLAQALQNYEGSLLLVSHDRNFIEQVANKIWYIEEGQIKEYPGNLQEYNAWMENRRLAEQSSDSESSAEDENEKPSKKQEYSQSERKNIQRELRKAQKQLDQVEGKLMEMEVDREELEAQLGKPEIYADNDKVREISQKLDEIKAKEKQLNEDWELHATAVGDLEEKLL
ncbi:ABC-F family ATP-binding cassette domain-containing protein [Persicobacter sp. CCB-QB2]|uniref:ABC-F family ATP-binding cassette domain-containing protein n=1 Tax=Persicobacter sp. CCB-QB2 TaxID=1561025 RepID=UPI0006A987AB|nr:ABC-F family ATP-binding cassette domain-containing protein [Persicobacter sp. CCB-QB2]